MTGHTYQLCMYVLPVVLLLLLQQAQILADYQ
jgi:hypothetical protein